MKRRGKGVACMFYPIGFTVYPNPSAVFMKVDIDGSAVVYTGATDIGQGSTTVLQQIASEASGIPCEKITMVTSDTKYTAYDTGSVASRVTLITGNAVKNAAEGVRDILFAAAAHKLHIYIGNVSSAMKVDDDLIYLDGYREAGISIGEAARYSTLTLGKPVVACGTYNPVTTVLNKENGHGKPYGSHVFATQIAIVDVDDETGEYTLEKIYAVHDCGKAINPMLLRGQIDGGIGMGVGFGCFEQIVTDKGRVINDQFTDYILPTALDVPPIVSDIVERFDPTGPYGAKGIGEPSLLPTASAIANAIFDAVGVLITDLPITSEKVYMGLKAKKEAARELNQVKGCL